MTYNLLIALATPANPLPFGPTDGLFFSSTNSSSAEVIWENGSQTTLSLIGGDLFPFRVTGVARLPTGGTLFACYADAQGAERAIEKMALNGFAPSGGVSMVATPASASIALPTGPTALVSNLGESPVFIALGAAGVVATRDSVCVLPNSQLALTTGGAGFIAAMSQAGRCGLNIAVGT